MSAQLPSITVITPSFNQGQFIRQTVESVLSQQYSQLEYIVIDGCSTDNTLEILNSYKNKLRLISEPDRGQTDAINKGLRMATGDIVCWLNSDDYFFPGTLINVGKHFANNPGSVWFTGDCQIVDENSSIIQEPIRYYKRLLRSLTPDFYMGFTNAICQPATFWRRQAHDQLGYLNEELRYTMDYDWWFRLLSLHKPDITKEILTGFRIHQASKGGSQFDMQFDEDFETFCNYNKGLLLRNCHYVHNMLIQFVYRQIKS